MRKFRLVSFSLMTMVLALSAAPAHAQGNTLAIAFEVTVKNGAAPAFEAALRELNLYRSEVGDPWVWNAYAVQFGEEMGTYIFRSPNHAWADLDAFGTSEANRLIGVQIGAMLGPHIESVRSRIMGTDPNLSRLPGDVNSMMIFNVAEFSLEASMAQEFDASMAAYKEAVEASAMDIHWSFQRTVSGGDALGVTIVGMGPNFASFELDPTAVPEMLVGHFGEERAQEIFEGFFGAVESGTTSTVVRRPDLSYTPN